LAVYFLPRMVVVIFNWRCNKVYCILGITAIFDKHIHDVIDINSVFSLKTSI